MISASQWLGALATPKWIVKLNDAFAKNPELNVEWYAPVTRAAYQVFPDGTEELEIECPPRGVMLFRDDARLTEEPRAVAPLVHAGCSTTPSVATAEEGGKDAPVHA